MADNQDVSFQLTAKDQTGPAFASLEKSLKGVGERVLDVRELFGALGAVTSVAGFAYLTDESIRAEAHLGDLAEIAGTTGVNIAGLELPALKAGTSLDTVASSIARLSRAVGEAQLGDEGKKSLFRALGMDPNDGTDAAQRMVDVARILVDMKDKNVAAKVSNELLGRSYAELRPFLKQVAESGSEVSKATEESIAAAKRYADGTATLSHLLTEEKRALANDLLPALNNIIAAMVTGQKEGEGFFTVLARGIQTALSGTDIHKANVEIVELTDKIAEAQNRLDRLRNEDANNTDPERGGFNARSIAELQAYIDKLKETVNARVQYRKMLEGDPSASPTGASPPATPKPDTSAAEAAVRARMEFEKNYTALIAAAKAGAEQFAVTVKLGNALAEEAYKQGEGSQVDLIRLTASNQDALLRVRIESNQEQLRLAREKGDKERVQTLQNAIAQMQAEREAAALIAQARVATAEEAARAESRGVLQRLLARQQALEQETLSETEQLRIELAGKMTLLDQSRANDLISEVTYQAQKTAIASTYAARRTLIEMQVSQSYRSMQSQNLGLAAGFFQALAGKSKEAALVALALQKAQAAATVIVMTEAAIAQAWARGPEVGAVVEGKLRVQEAISLGLIAATGLVEAAGIGGGGAAPGTPANPQIVQPVGPAAGGAALPAPTSTTIIQVPRGRQLKELFTGEDMFDFLKTVEEATRAGGRVIVE